MYGPVGHREPTRQTLHLGADQDGKLIALDHRTQTMSSTFDDFFESASGASHTPYASTAIATSHEAVRADVATPMFMRAPGEATGSIALESAIDQMAGPAAWILWRFGSRTMQRSNRSPASRSHRRLCANATGRALTALAGSAARSRRERCATATDCSLAGASALQRFRR
jgi:CO/xanthine dehydrogenase Mo-binding subunit